MVDVLGIAIEVPDGVLVEPTAGGYRVCGYTPDGSRIGVLVGLAGQATTVALVREVVASVDRVRIGGGQ